MTLMHSSRFAVGASRCVKRAFSQLGDLGSGKGKGGGSGGAIRDAGGVFGKRQQVHEEQYFKKLEREQMKSLRLRYQTLRKEMEREIVEHEEQALEHKEAAERLKRRIGELHEEELNLEKP